MSAVIIARHTGTKCAECRGVIKKGDPMLYANNDQGFIHAECEKDPDPWDGRVAPATTVLKRLTDSRGWLMDCMYQDQAFQLNDLPEGLVESVMNVVAAENKLRSLLEDVTEEHIFIDPERTRLESLERRVLEHEAAAMRKARRGL